MPRATELTGVTIGLRTGLAPDIGADGLPIHDALGQPKTRTLIVVVVADAQTGDTTSIPLTDEMFAQFAGFVCDRVTDDGLRRQLIEKLSGGIAIPGQVLELPRGAKRA